MANKFNPLGSGYKKFHRTAAQIFKDKVKNKPPKLVPQVDRRVKRFKVCPDGKRVPQGFPCKQLPPNRPPNRAKKINKKRSVIHKPILYGVHPPTSRTRRNGK